MISSLDGIFILDNVLLFGHTSEMVSVTLTYNGPAVETGRPKPGALDRIVNCGSDRLLISRENQARKRGLGEDRRYLIVVTPPSVADSMAFLANSVAAHSVVTKNFKIVKKEDGLRRVRVG